MNAGIILKKNRKFNDLAWKAPAASDIMSNFPARQKILDKILCNI